MTVVLKGSSQPKAFWLSWFSRQIRYADQTTRFAIFKSERRSFSLACTKMKFCSRTRISFGMKAETVKHFFLECSLYSSPRTNRLFSAACTFADRSSMSKAQIISVSFCLDHHYCLRSKIMPDLFLHLQSFISESLRFYKSNLSCIFVLQAYL